MNRHSEAKKITFKIEVPTGCYLLGAGDRTMGGDLWFNFVSLIWEVVPADFLNMPTENYVAARMKGLFDDNELPEFLREE